MLISFNIPSKAFSVNAMFYRNRSIKTTEARNWEMLILELIKDNKDIKAFSEIFDSEKHCIHVFLNFKYPKEVLITKNGTLSSKAFDLTNVEKPLIDVLFKKEFCSTLCKNLQIDDKFITKVTSEKSIGPKFNIEVKIQLIDLSSLQNTEQPLNV